MSVKEFKDYYKTLELLPSAKPEDIKKAYRKLAMKYHPDVNSSDYAVLHFREIQEAYEILSSPEQRRKYDEERWLNGISARAKDQVVVTPEWIWNESKKLSRHMQSVDVYRMNHGALNDYVFLLLSDAHMSVLLQTYDMEINRNIVAELLNATKALKYKYMQAVALRFAELVPADSETLEQIYRQVKQAEKSEMREKYLPLFIVIIAILLCILMFFYSKK